MKQHCVKGMHSVKLVFVVESIIISERRGKSITFLLQLKKLRLCLWFRADGRLALDCGVKILKVLSICFSY